VLRGTAVLLVTLRAHALLFSLPYMWLWTDGLDGIVRMGAVVAHGAALLAVGSASTARDKDRGVMPRVGLFRGARWSRPELATTFAQVLSLVAFAGIAALLVTDVHWMVPASFAFLLVSGLLWARAPLGVKYLGACELGAPLVVLVLPALALGIATPASPGLWSVMAGFCFLVAIVLATHLRDRGDDLSADIPTMATRRPAAANGWLWVTVIAAVIAVLVGIYLPLNFGEVAGIVGAVAFIGACMAERSRVPALIAAHAAVGLYWIFG
jgi:hypothetical protein